MLKSTTSSLAGLVASNLHCVVLSTMALTASAAPSDCTPASTQQQKRGRHAQKTQAQLNYAAATYQNKHPD
jgi:hypothetical protein